MILKQRRQDRGEGKQNVDETRKKEQDELKRSGDKSKEAIRRRKKRRFNDEIKSIWMIK